MDEENNKQHFNLDDLVLKNNSQLSKRTKKRRQKEAEQMNSPEDTFMV